MRIYRVKMYGSKRRLTVKWYVESRDVNGKQRHLALFTDKRASREAAEWIVKAIEQTQMSGVSPEIMQHLLKLPERTRRKLGDWGVTGIETASDKLATDLSEWHASIKQHSSEREAADQVQRAGRLLNACKVNRLCDLTEHRVGLALENLGKRRLAPQTRNTYIGALRQFIRWSLRNRRIYSDPISGLQKLPVTERIKRRALSFDEQRRLVDAAKNAGSWRGIPGPQRAMIYRVALATGYRASELAALKVFSFDFSASPPTATLPPMATKNRKGAVQPIPRDLAEALRAFFGLRDLDTTAFKVPPNYATAKMLRFDLKAAGIPFDTQDGVCDFHSLRHSFGSNLARAGVAPKVAMDLMRHSDVNLTMRLYAHTNLEERAAAIERVNSTD